MTRYTCSRQKIPLVLTRKGIWQHGKPLKVQKIRNAQILRVSDVNFPWVRSSLFFLIRTKLIKEKAKFLQKTTRSCFGLKKDTPVPLQLPHNFVFQIFLTSTFSVTVVLFGICQFPKTVQISCSFSQKVDKVSFLNLHWVRISVTHLFSLNLGRSHHLKRNKNLSQIHNSLLFNSFWSLLPRSFSTNAMLRSAQTKQKDRNTEQRR